MARRDAEKRMKQKVTLLVAALAKPVPPQWDYPIGDKAQGQEKGVPWNMTNVLTAKKRDIEKMNTPTILRKKPKPHLAGTDLSHSAPT